MRSYHFMENRWEKVEAMTDFIFLGSKITADGNCSHKIKRLLLFGRKRKYDKPRQHIKKQRHHFADKDPSSQSYGFSSNHVWMWELDYKESWVPKNWCSWIVLEKTLESPLDCKEIKPVNPEYSLEGLMLKLKLQYRGQFCQSIGEGLTHWKRPWYWERLKAGGERNDRGWDGWMAGWVASQTRQTSLSELQELVMDREAWQCCTAWGHKESDRTEWLNWMLICITYIFWKSTTYKFYIQLRLSTKSKSK